ncbi:MAG: biosynthetic-type acetolactate synthase large subunit [Candidatus Bathyarchaeota archaeon]|nr:biosynthetic-type acetolactate synthase large subunit [Candidatus Bathyarchaeota archaeon]
MVEMAGTKAFVKSLELEGVKHLFGLPGGVVIPLCDEILNGDFRFILARHEQGAAHMADGYARATGGVGVCLATSGPGAANLVTGVATANIDSSAIVAFTGQVTRAVIGTDAFQEVDIIGCSASVTKYNMQVRKTSEIPRAVKAAFQIASTGRKGAVLVDLPKDVTTDIEDVTFPETVKLRGYHPNYQPDPREVEWAATLLAKAKKPVVVAGGGVINSGSTRELVALSEYLMAPTATTLMGKGAFPADHPLSLGLCGMHGTQAANNIVPEADVLLIVGARLSDRTTGDVKSFAPNAKIIHLDIDRSEIDKNVETVTRVVGDASLALRGLLYNVSKLRAGGDLGNQWGKKVTEFKYQVNGNGNGHKEGYLRAPDVVRMLRKTLPREAIVTTEVGQCQMWAALHYDAYDPRTFFTSGGMGTMGWGFPAAIGVKAAKPDVPVVDIAGDGSFGMTENSMATSVEEELPVVVVVLNNQMLGMVAQWQRLFFDHRYSAVKLNGNPDMVKLAEAYGAEGVRVDSLGAFEAAVRRAIKSDISTVIDVPIDPEENVYPIVPPGAGLKDALLEA